MASSLFQIGILAKSMVNLTGHASSFITTDCASGAVVASTAILTIFLLTGNFGILVSNKKSAATRQSSHSDLTNPGAVSEEPDAQKGYFYVTGETR